MAEQTPKKVELWRVAMGVVGITLTVVGINYTLSQRLEKKIEEQTDESASQYEKLNETLSGLETEQALMKQQSAPLGDALEELKKNSVTEGVLEEKFLGAKLRSENLKDQLSSLTSRLEGVERGITEHRALYTNDFKEELRTRLNALGSDIKDLQEQIRGLPSSLRGGTTLTPDPRNKDPEGDGSDSEAPFDVVVKKVRGKGNSVVTVTLRFTSKTSKGVRLILSHDTRLTLRNQSYYVAKFNNPHSGKPTLTEEDTKYREFQYAAFEIRRRGTSDVVLVFDKNKWPPAPAKGQGDALLLRLSVSPYPLGTTNRDEGALPRESVTVGLP